jgi:spermidine synthase
VIFDSYSPYHHVQVIDQGGQRLLSFNGSMETRMSLANPLEGHFEYTESFHLPRLWQPEGKRVLMLGLGGGSTQRAYRHDYPAVTVETVELDPVVIRVAKQYFGVEESPQHKIHNEDGRVFLRRTTQQYDIILLDAYTTSRYGSTIPYHLATREFFTLASQHLSTNGVLAYNVIGTVHGWRADLVGAMAKTLQAVFPQVYCFPSRETRNVVLVATKHRERFSRTRINQTIAELTREGRVKLPTLALRAATLFEGLPPSAHASPVLTDQRAPVEGLSGRNKW